MNINRIRAIEAEEIKEELRTFFERPGYKGLFYAFEEKITRYYLEALVISEGHVKYGYALAPDQMAVTGVKCLAEMLAATVPADFGAFFLLGKGAADLYLQIRDSQEMKKEMKKYKHVTATLSGSLVLAQKVARRFSLELVRAIGNASKDIRDLDRDIIVQRAFEHSLVWLPIERAFQSDRVAERAALNSASIAKNWDKLIKNEPNKLTLRGLFEEALEYFGLGAEAAEAARQFSNFAIDLSKRQ